MYLISSKDKKRTISYVGYTNDIKKRLRLHNSSKGAKFTKGKMFVVFFIIFCFGWNPKTVMTGDVASFPGYRIPVKVINKVFTG